MNIKGIDVSVWQGKIDWKKVKASGIVFAMIRVGYGSSQGNDCKMDTYFKANVEGALAAGVEVGIYFYSYAKSAQAAVKEAAWVVEQIAPYKGRILYPIAYDLEDSKQAGLGRDVLTAMVTAFCTTIEAAGYYASFYCNTNWCKNMLNMDDLKGFDPVAGTVGQPSRRRPTASACGSAAALAALQASTGASIWTSRTRTMRPLSSAQG